MTTSQCRMLARTLFGNACVRDEGHTGKHRNWYGMWFTSGVDCAGDIHATIVKLAACSTHHRYSAARRPRIPCEGCWRLWILTHPDVELETRWMR